MTSHIALEGRPAELYIDLLKRSLGGELEPAGIPESALDEGIGWPVPYPKGIVTMLGRRRLDNLHHCLESALADSVPGDVIETGVWRGGAVILMRGILVARGIRDRKVVVADSFEGVPPPDVERFPSDSDMTLHLNEELAVSADQVRANFARYGLLDSQVEFVPGWFKDTLPGLSDRRWALIRLDGDLYESTLEALEALYPQLSPGGYLIVDDYGAYEACRAAVADFRGGRGIREEIKTVDWTGAYWRRET